MRNIWLAYLDLTQISPCLFSLEGSLARIGPNDLICSDPDVIRRMGTAKLRYRRSRFYSSFAFNPDQDTMLSTTDEKIHADLKVKTAACVGYSFRKA